MRFQSRGLAGAWVVICAARRSKLPIHVGVDVRRSPRRMRTVCACVCRPLSRIFVVVYAALDWCRRAVERCIRLARPQGAHLLDLSLREKVVAEVEVDFAYRLVAPGVPRQARRRRKFASSRVPRPVIVVARWREFLASFAPLTRVGRPPSARGRGRRTSARLLCVLRRRRPVRIRRRSHHLRWVRGCPMGLLPFWSIAFQGLAYRARPP